MRKRLSIRYSPLDRYVSVELFELSDESNKTIKLDKEKYVPRFVCIAFPKKDIEDELKAESKKDIDNPIIINSLEDLEKEVYDKLESNVQDYILKNYTAERKRYLTLTEQAWVLEMINAILIEVLGAIAENERNKIRARQREGIVAAKKKNVRFGRPPKSLLCPPELKSLYFEENTEIQAFLLPTESSFK